MSDADLQQLVRDENLDQSEVEQLFASHFGFASGVSLREIHYAHDGTHDPALIVYYAHNGEIASVKNGPGLRAGDVDAIKAKIREQLLVPGPVQIGQLVLFSSLPTVGHFRFQDRFQITPVPADAPRPPFAIGDHPLLLQYAVNASVDSMISVVRRARLGRELELVLFALASIKGSTGSKARFHWTLTPGEMQSAYCQETYSWPGANGLAQQFDSIDGVTAITLTPAREFYARPGFTVGQNLDLPDCLPQLLSIYFRAEKTIRDQFLRACFWFQNAFQAAQYSNSSSFTSLVSAIETLMGPNPGGERCTACGKEKEGPTSRFIRFVEKFAPSPSIDAKQRKKLYGLRSALSHGGTLLHSDQSGWHGGMTPDMLAEWEDHGTLRSLVRVVLVNWLAAQQLPPEPSA